MALSPIASSSFASAVLRVAYRDAAERLGVGEHDRLLS